MENVQQFIDKNCMCLFLHISAYFQMG